MKSENTVFLVFGLVLVLVGGYGVASAVQTYVQKIVPMQGTYQLCIEGSCYGPVTVPQSLWDTVYLYAIGGIIVLILGLSLAIFAFKRENPSPKQYDYQHPQQT
jgi:hypothetical protein